MRTEDENLQLTPDTEGSDEDLLQLPLEEDGPEGASPEKAAAAKKKERMNDVIFYVIIILAAFVIWRFVLLNAKVPTGSMENTIMSAVSMGLRCAYWFSEPERGDIVVFYAPDHPDTLYVKRVIGMPGDRVEIVNGTTYINGEALQEDYLPEPMEGDYGPYQVPDGAYFMMGDNRNHSADARDWINTYVYEDAIIGKAYFSYWPKLRWID